MDSGPQEDTSTPGQPGLQNQNLSKNTNHHHHHSYVSDLKMDLSHGTSLPVPLPTVATLTKPLFNAFRRYRFSESHVSQGSLELGTDLTSAGSQNRHPPHSIYEPGASRMLDSQVPSSQLLLSVNVTMAWVLSFVGWDLYSHECSLKLQKRYHKTILTSPQDTSGIGLPWVSQLTIYLNN